ncbi:ATP-dependent DNA helicase PIF1-like protein [Tanacetum coccineum]|uniref:ATP-dependent DNA helicase PIF1-like protein n=1 Tax=Tanacetum coccineum TaxID=301880 RepID=A0ABQ4YEF4_9ASTR
MLAHVPGQRAHDRPEVGTRVFKLKLTELLEDLTKNKIFGESRTVVYVIEFQKRGLPHAHILLWLEDHCKCRTLGEIDDIISAELPSSTNDPAGYKAVTDYMLHGPCGKDARYAPSKFPPSAQSEQVTLRDSECLSALLEREGINVTMFTDWFALNERYPPTRARTYAEIPQYYVWYERLKMWKPQKQKKCIGRIVYSTPASGERYFLRMLLNVVRGPLNLDELLTVNKRVCSTLKEECFAYGLLNDDREWTRAIQEASVWALGPQLRDLFVTILLFCDVIRPLKLWEKPEKFYQKTFFT